PCFFVAIVRDYGFRTGAKTVVRRSFYFYRSRQLGRPTEPQALRFQERAEIGRQFALTASSARENVKMKSCANSHERGIVDVQLRAADNHCVCYWKLVATHHFVYAGDNLLRRVCDLANLLLIEQLSPLRSAERLTVFFIRGQITIVLLRP